MRAFFLFDFYIPVDSPLRDEKIVGTSATSISGISTGDFFVLSQTNGLWFSKEECNPE